MKPNLILLHGALGTKAQFKTIKEQLSDHFKVHDLDFEGHGSNPSSNEFTMELFAQNVIQYLTEHNIEQTHIFGYSMGGYVGLTVAKSTPERIGKIVTLGTKFNWTKEIAEQEIKMLNPDKIEEKVPAFAQSLQTIHTHNNWKEMMKKTANMMLGLGMGKRFSSDDLEKIDTEVLIGIGDKDRMVSIEESKESANILPNGQLKIIEGFPHPIEKVDTEVLKSIIIDFVQPK